jgi:hypothetical protein
VVQHLVEKKIATKTFLQASENLVTQTQSAAPLPLLFQPLTKAIVYPLPPQTFTTNQIDKCTDPIVEPGV